MSGHIHRKWRKAEVRGGATRAWRDHSHLQTLSSPSGEVDAPDLAGCSAGVANLANLEEEKDVQKERERQGEEGDQENREKQEEKEDNNESE